MTPSYSTAASLRQRLDIAIHLYIRDEPGPLAPLFSTYFLLLPALPPRPPRLPAPASRAPALSVPDHFHEAKLRGSGQGRNREAVERGGGRAGGSAVHPRPFDNTAPTYRASCHSRRIPVLSLPGDFVEVLAHLRSGRATHNTRPVRRRPEQTARMKRTLMSSVGAHSVETRPR